MTQFLLGLASGIMVFLLTGMIRFTWNELDSAKRLFRHFAPNLIYAGMSLMLASGIAFLFGIEDFNHIRSARDLQPSVAVISMASVGALVFALPFLMVWLVELVKMLKPEQSARAKDPASEKAEGKVPQDAPKWRYRPLRRVDSSTRWTERS